MISNLCERTWKCSIHTYINDSYRLSAYYVPCLFWSLHLYFKNTFKELDNSNFDAALILQGRVGLV